MASMQVIIMLIHVTIICTEAYLIVESNKLHDISAANF